MPLPPPQSSTSLRQETVCNLALACAISATGIAIDELRLEPGSNLNLGGQKVLLNRDFKLTQALARG
jgi:hypothetical protein